MSKQSLAASSNSTTPSHRRRRRNTEDNHHQRALCVKCSEDQHIRDQHRRSHSLTHVNAQGTNCEFCGVHLLQVPPTQQQHNNKKHHRSRRIRRRARSLFCIRPVKSAKNRPLDGAEEERFAVPNHKKTRSLTEHEMHHHSNSSNRLTSRRFSAHPPSPLASKEQVDKTFPTDNNADDHPDTNKNVENEMCGSSEKSKSNESVVFKDALNNVNGGGNDTDDVVDDRLTEELGSGEPQTPRQNPPRTLNLQTNNNHHQDMLTTSSPNNSPFPQVREENDPVFPLMKKTPKTPTQHHEDDDPKPRHRKKKRTSASWYNVLSPTYRQKNEHFHKFFKDVPENERLLVDASCALVNDILVQGRLYVSQNYVCFHSNFLKWQKAVVIKFDECSKITKEKLAKIFPNSICFQTESRGKQLFTSFTSRDRTFTQIMKVWQLSKLDEPMTSQQLWDNVREQYGSELGCSSDSDYCKADSADGDNSRKRKKKNSKKKNKTLDEVAPSSSFNPPSTKEEAVNASIRSEGNPQSSVIDDSQASEADEVSIISEERASSPNSFIGALSTEFPDSDPTPSDHVIGNLNHVYLDEKYPVSAAELFNILFGDNNSFYQQYLLDKGTTNVKWGTWSSPSDGNDGNRTRVHDYTMPLNHPLGPKSSRIVEEQILYKSSDLGRTYAIDCVTQNYNIPYSDYFQTIVRYSIRKIGFRKSELRVSVGIKFLKDPWGMVKSFIEKNAYAGIQDNFQQLSVELRNFVNKNYSEKPKVAAMKAKENKDPATSSQTAASSASRQPDSTVRQRNVTKTTTDPKTVKENTTATTTAVVKNEVIKVESSPSTSLLSTVKDLFTKIPPLNSSHIISFSFLFLMIVVLLYHNYTMHYRLVSLESALQAHESTAEKSVGGSELENLLRDVITRLDRLEACWREKRQIDDVRWAEEESKWTKLYQYISRNDADNEHQQQQMRTPTADKRVDPN